MKRLLTAIILIILVLAGTLVWWKNGTMAANPNDHTPQIFVVEKGEGMRKIANDLKIKGLIKDPIVFFLLTRKLGIDTKVQAGDFRLNPSMSAYDVAQNLTHGTLDIWVTILEGNRAGEIADILEKSVPSFKSSWRSALMANEGYLFPDTYLIPRDATVDQVISLMKNNFDAKYTALKNEQTTNLTENETIIIASIIEREAQFTNDRPIVASVIMNRLDLGMSLGVDPAIQYALGYQANEKSWWKKELTADDLKINSPYNTRTNVGLPPTPISNPGETSIKAALNPAKTDYLYYLSDSSGHLHFATTLQGHNANISKYLGN